jgi:TolB-like protein
MKIKISLITALFLTGALAYAAPPSVTVAVYGFVGDGHVRGYPGTVTTLVTADLATETNLILVERAQLMGALGEQALGVSGMVSPDTAAKIGQITGAKILVGGQVIKIGDNHLAVVASIIGTETGRLFADKVEGPMDNLTQLTFDLSQKIAQTISDQTTNLITAPQETEEERLDRIIASLSGTNRPSVSVTINWPQGKRRPNVPAETEFARILLKAGFTVVDGRSDNKADIEITGMSDGDNAPNQSEMFSFQVVIELKVQERETGKIIAVEHQPASATDATQAGANRAAIVNAVDKLAEQVLPLLAQ